MTWLLVWFFILAMAACSSSAQPTKPIASITAPANGSTFFVGQPVAIAFTAADVKGVAQVELSIDGQPVRVEPVNPPVNSFAATHTWRPEVAGSHALELRAFNVDGQVSDLAQIAVTILAAAAAAETPLPTPIELTPTPAPIAFTPTFTPLPPESPASVTAENKALVTALVGLNVRTGPGTQYPRLGMLAKGESAEITGRDQFTGWWQIVFISNQGERGWVAAGPEFSTATNAGNVPVVAAPPPPVGGEPTATPTSPASVVKPTIHSFTADRYAIALGEQVTLRWDLSNAEAAYLRYNNQEEGVVAPGSKVVAPNRETVYTLTARNQAGETTAQVVIKVGGATATPVPVWQDGKVRILNGQNVDFDQGVVQDATGSGTDFYWDGSQQRFSPRNGASGALLGKPYDQISLADCLAATYGQPIGGVDGSTLITGCYITNEGRYGKFYVSEWDLAANLTVSWLTWDYR
jgi:hypothetical protein